MPSRHFLTAAIPLAEQVTNWLVSHRQPDTMLITSTSDSARRIVAKAEAAGVLRLRSALPMSSLLPETESLATEVERCLAWTESLRTRATSEHRALFWNRRPETDAELFESARNFVRLCDRLAEGGYTPTNIQRLPLTEGHFETERWSVMARLYERYLDYLCSWGLTDPNSALLKQIESPSAGIGHLVIAVVPDLPRVFERYAEWLERNGTRVDILIWNPSRVDEHDFDRWGRPEPERWRNRTIPIQEGQISVCQTVRDEARTVVEAFLEAPSGIVTLDPKLESPLVGEILLHRQTPRLPGGEDLIHCEAAKLALNWEEFRHSRDLRRLSRLLELPAFCRTLDPEDPLTQTDALVAIDHLLGKTIAATVDDAWAASTALPEESRSKDRGIRGKVRRLLGLVRSRLGISALELVEIAFPDSDGPRAESCSRVIEIGRYLADSSALRALSGRGTSRGLPAAIFDRAIRNEKIQSPSKEGGITLNGWLEAPWLPAQRLILCGLIESQFPKAADGDPFLPDSICPGLGLSHNEQRLARDAYLLHALLASRPAEDIRLSYSKYDNDGDPNRPSRLLLRTDEKALPERVRHLMRLPASGLGRPTGLADWRWQLPCELSRVERISPTQFESYLACPFRFCLKHVLRLDTGPQAAQEMDAPIFGTLIHNTLEKFGLESIRLGKDMLGWDESAIQDRVDSLLEAEALAQFGPQPPPAVRIQLASAVARLRAFARVQAATFREGWIILSVERELKADDENPLLIGSLPLSGIIDRIEQHAETGALRIVDYKTFSAPKKPSETHLGPVSRNWLEAALVEIATSKGAVRKTWINLQLPLYRRILEHWYPDECAAQPPEAAYFLLPADPEETQIVHLEELDASVDPNAYASALTCAEAVSRSIEAGVFWPPQPFRDSWDDPAGPLFTNGAPEDCIAPDTIELLKGERG